MNIINNDNDESQEIRPQIKINKKMRMWNKYKNYCFIVAGILVVVLVVGLCVSLLPDENSKKPANNETPVATKDYIAQLGTLEETKDVEQSSGATTEGTEAQTQKPTETPTQAPTEAPTQAPTQTATSAPQVVAFNTKDKFKDAVFVGDTVINGISYYKHLPSAQVISDVNMVSSDAAGKVSSIMASNPKKVFIMVGLNDANYGTYKTDDIVKNIEKFVKAVKAKSSSTEVYVMSVLPITKAFESKSSVKQSFLNELNYSLSTKVSSMGAKYIDVATNFKDSDGYMFTQCTGTGYNLKQNYYGYFLNKIAALM